MTSVFLFDTSPQKITILRKKTPNIMLVLQAYNLDNLDKKTCKREGKLFSKEMN